MSASRPQDRPVSQETFQPLRRASGPKRIAAMVFGPLLWLVALVVVAWLLGRADLIELGLAIAGASFVIAVLVLSLLRVGRGREERRYVDRA